MADRLLVDLDGAGPQVTVATWPENQPLEIVSQARLLWPLDDHALEDLRWYLEDYLRAPFGVWQNRGSRIQEQLAGWGDAVFASVFGSGSARDAYQRARDRGLELVFRSAEPGLLGLPWELMYDPAGPVALGLAGVSRALPVTDLTATATITGGRLRVLMVISRPSGTEDVGYQMIARPLLERLAAVRSLVDLVVLRPPTLEALRSALVEAAAVGKPFQVVHFDGHGTLHADYGSLLMLQSQHGGAHPVAASRVAAVLKDAQVPVVVLNACQSGAIGKQVEAAVATRLLRDGCAAVVGMAYNVYAVAAAEFMAVFYERLFAGDAISVAVTAGRRRLFEQDLRPSPKGDLPLADWLVPVHYLRRDVAFPQARARRRTAEPSLETLLDDLRKPDMEQAGGVGDLDPVGIFTGRDDLVFELEWATRLQRVVVLHGPGGTGKTELAKAFGRWWRDTGGVERPEWVFWHSFEPGVASFGLDGVITEIGLQVFGPDFARLDSDERQRMVEILLVQRRLLLIWDNFEAVHSMPDPDGVTPPLEDAECAKIEGFLAQLAEDGKSAVVITSRTDEGWLGPIRRIEVGGLAPDEAVQYAGQLLAPYPAVLPRRARRAFGELLEWLDGHPLSMRLILPRLDQTEPEMLLDGLRGTAPLLHGEDGDRATSLAASISYSFTHLAVRTRQLLLAAGLFQDVADANVLVLFSGTSSVPHQFAGASYQDWEEILNDAARVGLLTPLGAGMFRIQPTLPAYLAEFWRSEDRAHYGSVRNAATRALASAYAWFGQYLKGKIGAGDAGMAYALIDLQRRTFGAMLGYALDHQMWVEALAIAEPLNEYWKTRGLGQEASAWTAHGQMATENHEGNAPRLDTPAGALWLFMTQAQVNRLSRTLRLEDAERAYGQILDMLQAQPSSQQQYQIANVTANFGMDAHARGREREAEDLLRKSLAIWESLGDQPGMALSYYNLGVISHEQERMEEAENWFRKSLAIRESLEDQPGMAFNYHAFGNSAYLQGQLEEAEEWYRKSLAIREVLEDWPNIADSYHQLGMTAQERGRLEDAEDWYRQSLSIQKELGNRRGMARTYGQLSLLAALRGQARQAVDWTVRCVTLFEEFPDPAAGRGPRNLARLTAIVGIDIVERSWQEVTGSPLPQVVRDYILPGPKNN